MIVLIKPGFIFQVLPSVAIALMCLCPSSRGQAKQEKTELKVFASTGDWGGQFRKGGEAVGNQMRVFRVAPDKATYEQMIKLLKVQKIDWDKQMLVLYEGAAGRTPQHRMEFKNLWLANGELKWGLVDTGDEPKCYTQHWALVLTEKVDGNLFKKFDEAAK